MYHIHQTSGTFLLEHLLSQSPLPFEASRHLSLSVSLSCLSPLQCPVSSTHLSSPLLSCGLSTLCPHQSHTSSFACLVHSSLATIFSPPPLEIYQRISSTEVRCTSKNNSAELHSICFCSEINLENNIKLENLLCAYYLPSMVIDLILSELWACLDVVGTMWEPLPSSGTSG